MMLPALFVGHGNPMNAIEDNEYSRTMRQIASQLPQPQAILCISAHWETNGTFLTAAAQPSTIHDFRGFPPSLFAVQYPAPGAPVLARQIADLLPAQLDTGRGFDHGTWGILRPMYPQAAIPVVQLSLNRDLSFAQHFELARKLAPLRSEGVLILGSGNIVHNLARIDFQLSGGHPWAEQFNNELKQLILAGDNATLTNPEKLPGYPLAVPTPEHYLPLLYITALRTPQDQLTFFNDSCDLGSISMTSFVIA